METIVIFAELHAATAEPETDNGKSKQIIKIKTPVMLFYGFSVFVPYSWPYIRCFKIEINVYPAQLCLQQCSLQSCYVFLLFV